MIEGAGGWTLLGIGCGLAVVVGHAFVLAWIEEHRYGYDPHRRALRELARSNPRRSKP